MTGKKILDLLLLSHSLTNTRACWTLSVNGKHVVVRECAAVQDPACWRTARATHTYLQICKGSYLVGTLLHTQASHCYKLEVLNAKWPTLISEYCPYRVVTGTRSGLEFYLHLSSGCHLYDNLKGWWLAEPQKSNAMVSPIQSDLYKVQASVQT